MKHTDTPGPIFKVQNGSHIDIHERVFPDNEQSRELTVARDVRPEYVDAIVRACNNYADMLAALEAVIEDTQHGELLTYGKLWKARAAIAKAKGE